METSTSARGFKNMSFYDANNRKCRLGESSAALHSCIWFGTNVSVMHLTQEQVRELLPHLHKFVETGKL